ncbi:MAG: DUF1643 domain-containing protein [Parashewanella sp.]
MEYPKFVLNEQIGINEEEDGSNNYRYSLNIPLDKGNNKKYTVIMMNPSTANSSKSDLTIDRVIRFIEQTDSNASEISIVNLYAERETYSEYLELKSNTHRKNIQTIKNAVSNSDTVILGWGKPTNGTQKRLHEIRYHHIALEVLQVCESLNVTPKIIESLREGLYPRHPGRISYSAKLVDLDVVNQIDILKKRIQKNTVKFQPAPNK